MTGSPPGPPWASTPPAPPAPPPPPAETPSSRRWWIVGIAGTVAFMLVVGAVAVPLLVRELRKDRSPTLAQVRVYEQVGAEHTENDVEYDPVPPVGGPHDPAWLECGVYDEPVREENTVHSLEHGTVWITYDPDLSDGDVAELEDRLPTEGILSPHPGQDAPVVITVWARQLDLDGADDPRLELFLAEYGDGHTAPEPMASCAGGVQENEEQDVTGVNV